MQAAADLSTALGGQVVHDGCGGHSLASAGGSLDEGQGVLQRCFDSCGLGGVQVWQAGHRALLGHDCMQRLRRDLVSQQPAPHSCFQLGAGLPVWTGSRQAGDGIVSGLPAGRQACSSRWTHAAQRTCMRPAGCQVCLFAGGLRAGIEQVAYLWYRYPDTEVWSTAKVRRAVCMRSKGTLFQMYSTVQSTVV